MTDKEDKIKTTNQTPIQTLTLTLGELEEVFLATDEEYITSIDLNGAIDLVEKQKSDGLRKIFNNSFKGLNGLEGIIEMLTIVHNPLTTKVISADLKNYEAEEEQTLKKIIDKLLKVNQQSIFQQDLTKIKEGKTNDFITNRINNLCQDGKRGLGNFTNFSTYQTFSQENISEPVVTTHEVKIRELLSESNNINDKRIQDLILFFVVQSNIFNFQSILAALTYQKFATSLSIVNHNIKVIDNKLIFDFDIKEPGYDSPTLCHTTIELDIEKITEANKDRASSENFALLDTILPKDAVTIKYDVYDPILLLKNEHLNGKIVNNQEAIKAAAIAKIKKIIETPLEELKPGKIIEIPKETMLSIEVDFLINTAIENGASKKELQDLSNMLNKLKVTIIDEIQNTNTNLKKNKKPNDDARNDLKNRCLGMIESIILYPNYGIEQEEIGFLINTAIENGASKKELQNTKNLLKQAIDTHPNQNIWKEMDALLDEKIKENFPSIFTRMANSLTAIANKTVSTIKDYGKAIIMTAAAILVVGAAATAIAHFYIPAAATAATVAAVAIVITGAAGLVSTALTAGYYSITKSSNMEKTGNESDELYLDDDKKEKQESKIDINLIITKDDNTIELENKDNKVIINLDNNNITIKHTVYTLNDLNIQDLQSLENLNEEQYKKIFDAAIQKYSSEQEQTIPATQPTIPRSKSISDISGIS